MDTCENLDYIIQSEFYEDPFSEKLINIYCDYVNNNKGDSKLKILKNCFVKYIKDYNFSKELKNKIDVSLVVSKKFNQNEELLNFVLEFFKTYKEEPLKVQTRWL